MCGPCVECYAQIGEQVGSPSSLCLHPSCYNYIHLISTAPPDDYQIPGSVNGSTNKCSDIRDDQCTYIYHVAHSPNGTLTAVEPPVCLLLLPPWAIAVVILVALILIGIILLIVIKVRCF